MVKTISRPSTQSEQEIKLFSVPNKQGVGSASPILKLPILNVVTNPPISKHLSLRTLAIKRLRELALYNDGWYGENTLAPSSQTIKDAESFIWSMDWDSLDQPFIGLAEDGEISFLWKNSKIDIDLGFYGTETYSYYAKLKDVKGTEFLKDDVPASEPLPEDLLACLPIKQT